MRVCARRGRAEGARGCIVNTASMLSFFGGGLVPGYSASKGGVAQLTKSLAIAYAADGIRVNAVAPGWIATPLTQALQDDRRAPRPILARTPMGRWGTPDDVAGPVLFLASAAARFVTGVVLPVDGGYLISLKESRMIVQLPGIQPEIADPGHPDDERVWVPQAPGVWFRPLLLNTVTGSWCNLLRVRKAGVLSRHIHPSWVTGYVIRGAWRYLEHDWVATEGSFVYEPPGEIHTLVVDEQVGATEMITFFNIHGAMVYVDEAGR
jgi:quercetin dioxygenase-like cupin family protein